MSRVPIFIPEEREQLRQELVAAAQSDPNLCGAAHTGSAASSRLDRWSDVDLALCIKSTASHDEVVAGWTDRLYQRHNAVTHVDVMHGATLFRVFLLKNTLQVDLAFWSAADFGAIGPNFQLIFGVANSPRPAPVPNVQTLIGMAWLYGLHVRSSLARGRRLQTEYMLGGMRNHVLELACVRCGVVAHQGRGLDDLPLPEREMAAACLPKSLDPSELQSAFRATMQALLKEVGQVDQELETRLAGPLNDMLW